MVMDHSPYWDWPGFDQKYIEPSGYYEIIEAGAFGEMTEEQVREAIFRRGRPFVVIRDSWGGDGAILTRTIHEARLFTRFSKLDDIPMDSIMVSTKHLDDHQAHQLHYRVNALITGPPIVCLCGSTRFKKEYEEQNRRLTSEGYIVLSVGMFAHSGDEVSEDLKERLDLLHKQKINLAEEVVIICPDGYIGDSTRSELDWARSLGKTIRFPYGRPEGEGPLGATI